MKKFFVLMMVAAMSIACASVEEQAKEKQEAILKAIAEGKTEEAEKLTKEYDEWYKGLSDEDKKAVDKAAEAAAEKAVEAAGAAAGAAAEAMGL